MGMYDDLLCDYPLPQRPAWSLGRGFCTPSLDWAFDPHVICADGVLLRCMEQGATEIDPYSGALHFFAKQEHHTGTSPEAHYYAHFQAGHLQAIVHSPTAISPLVAQQAVDTELQRVLLHKALCQATDELGTVVAKANKI